MKLNLKFYSDKYVYNDGDIEDKILDFIKRYPKNYEEAFIEDSSWPVIYHLSKMRSNIIKWYPFKKTDSILEVGAGMGAITSELVNKCGSVTSVELSKRRATAILERNKKATNLEIIVGNFKDIKFEQKYNYILLNGVLEYAAMYIDSQTPYKDFILKLKKLLKPNGKILIAIENRMGLKYWCGAEEDHTSVKFDGLNKYPNCNNIRTFSKKELENLFNTCEMVPNFYYVFPDYKFPEIILTDESNKSNYSNTYRPYYYKNMDMFINESLVFKDICDNGMIPQFANSYFVELSNKKEDKKIEYVKFNNYRNDKYNLYTYAEKKEFYKVPTTSIAINHVEQMINNNKLLDKLGINVLPIKVKNNQIVCTKIIGENLEEKLIREYKLGNFDYIYKTFDQIIDIIKKAAGKEISNPKENIFDKYGIELTKDQRDSIKIYEHGFVDLTLSNIYVVNKKITIIDQEWYESNCSIEYVVFRLINNFGISLGSDLIKQELFEKYNIDSNLYFQLESKFINNVVSNLYLYFDNNYNFNSNIINYQNVIDDLNQQNAELTKTLESYKNNVEILTKDNHYLNNQINDLNQNYNMIVNSKRWKIISKLFKIIGR